MSEGNRIPQQSEIKPQLSPTEASDTFIATGGGLNYSLTLGWISKILAIGAVAESAYQEYTGNLVQGGNELPKVVLAAAGTAVLSKALSSRPANWVFKNTYRRLIPDLSKAPKTK